MPLWIAIADCCCGFIIVDWLRITLIRCSGACRRAPFRFACRAPLRFACHAPLRFACHAPLCFACHAPLRFAYRASLRFACHAPLCFACHALLRRCAMRRCGLRRCGLRHFVPLHFVRARPLRLVCAASGSIRAPPRCWPGRHLRCRIKRHFSAIPSASRALFRAPFVCYIESYFKRCL